MQPIFLENEHIVLIYNTSIIPQRKHFQNHTLNGCFENLWQQSVKESGLTLLSNGNDAVLMR